MAKTCSSCGGDLIPGRGAKGLCGRCYSREYERLHHDERRAYLRAHPEIGRASTARWSANHKEHHAAYARAYNQARSDADIRRMNDRRRERRNADLDAANAKRRAYWAANAERQRAYAREFRAGYWANPANLARRQALERERLQRLHVRVKRWATEQRRRGVPPTLEALAYAAMLFQDPCAYCGSRERVSIDHIVPISRGGESTTENLTACCLRCNKRKWATPVYRFMAKAGAA